MLHSSWHSTNHLVEPSTIPDLYPTQIILSPMRNMCKIFIQWYKCTKYLGYQEFSMLKSILVNKDIQTWRLIGWQHSRQPMRSHVRKSLLTNVSDS